MSISQNLAFGSCQAGEEYHAANLLAVEEELEERRSSRIGQSPCT